jgi:hypothetical protein
MRIIIVPVFLLISFTGMAQTIYDFIEKLDKVGLVSPWEKKAILKEIKAREEHLKKFKDRINREDEMERMKQPHFPLHVLKMIKKYSTSGTDNGFSFTPALVEIPKGKEKEVITRLEKFAQQILSTKFISAKTYDETVSKIRSLDLRSEFEVTAFAGSATEQEYFLSPIRYKKFADGLFSRGLISRQGYDEIMEKSAAGDFRDYQEPLRYLKNFVIIDLKKYSIKPEEYIESIYRTTSDVFPGLHFDSIKYTTESNKRESSEGFIVSDMAVTLKKAGRSFMYRSFFDAEYKNKKKEDYSQLPESYYQVFNKMLADDFSSYRLHQVSLNGYSFGIFALTKQQFEGLMWSYDGMTAGGYIQLSYENFTNKITQKKIKEAITLYDSIGLLSQLSKEEKDSCINDVANKEINYFSDILSSFKNLVFEIDLEYGVNDRQYRELTKKIADISKGNFNPGNIIDTYNYEKRKSFDYGFTLNGKTHKTKLYQDDDWIDPKFWEFIVAAVTEHDKKGRFYYLYPSDGLRQIYLTKEQAEILQAKRMIELNEADLEN